MRLRPFRRFTLLKWCTWRWCDAAQLLPFFEEVERALPRTFHARAIGGQRSVTAVRSPSLPATLPRWGEGSR